jgi:hypothetical protein
MVAILTRVKIEQELLSLREAAQLLGISHVHMWRLVTEGDDIPVVRVGLDQKPSYGIRREVVENLKAERAVKTTD